MSSKFLKVKCEKCKNEQVIFSKPATVVKCLVCGTVLGEPTGSSINLKVKKTLPVKLTEKEKE